MGDKVTAAVELVDDKVKFSGKARGNPEVVCDFFPPLGQGEGYTGLELLLVSLAACAGTSVASILRSMHKNVAGLAVEASGVRRDEHPTRFQTINLVFRLRSSDAEAEHLEKAVRLSEETYCPVWAMIKNNADIAWEASVEK